MPHRRFNLLNPTKSVHRSLTGLKLSAVLLLGLGLTGLQAQEVIPSSGGNASGSGGTVSYSVGQVFYSINTGTSGSVAQGVQQPYEISGISSIDEAKGITLILLPYPNPTTDYLTLEVDASTLLNIRSLSYQLYDINGKLLMNKNIESTETSIPTSYLIPGTYFLRILSNQGLSSQKEIKTFKVIKN